MLFFAPYRTPLDASGRVMAGTQLWFTLTGTDTEVDTFSDAARTTPNPNPVIANASGQFDPIYLDPETSYRVRLYSAWSTVGVDTPLEEYDPYTSGFEDAAEILNGRVSVSVKSYDAVGDGTTDDTANLNTAVAQAMTLETDLYWPEGDYLTSASILDFWNVRHWGPGRILRDGETFYVQPRAAQTNKVYCNPVSGSADNDGLSANDPIDEIDQAFTNLENYGPILDGRWEIYAAAGTYAKVAVDDQFRVQWRLNVYGPVSAQANGVEVIIEISAASGNFTIGETITGTSGATATVAEQQALGASTTFLRATATNATAFAVGNTVTGGTSAKTGVIQAIHVVPTAIIDDQGTTGDTGFDSRGEARIILNNIKITGFSTGNGIVHERGRLSLSNVHIDNCLNGITNLNGGLVTFSNGGVYDGNSLASGRGYADFYNAVHDCGASTLATGPLFHNWERGILVNEGSQGHLDNVKVWNCTVAGVNIKRGSGAVNANSLQLYRNAIGLLAENNGWYDNSIDFGSGTNANTINVQAIGDSPELTALTIDNTARTERVIVPTTSVATHTGTLTDTTLYTTPAAPRWSLSTSDTKGRTVISFTVQSTLSASATVSLYAYDGTTEDLLENVVVPSGVTDARFVCDVGYSAHNSQKGTIYFVSNSGVACDYGTGALNLKGIVHYLRIKVQLGNVADTFQIADLDVRSSLWS